MHDIVINVENLSKCYRLYDNPADRLKESIHPFRKKYHKDFYALNNINFEVKRGAVHRHYRQERVRVDPSIAYATYFGSAGPEFSDFVDVDVAGNVYVQGMTQATNFPTANALYPTYGGGSFDVFVVKINRRAIRCCSRPTLAATGGITRGVSPSTPPGTSISPDRQTR